MKKRFKHLFYPHDLNNYRAKLLHFDSLLILIFFFVAGAFLFSGIKSNFPSVLGISTGMTVDQLLALTNEKRIENGLSPLTLNNQLSVAASSKADDMFIKNYWSHNSPDGTSPWDFIKGAGYTYTYAGENLARGFDNPSDVVNAWMASPEHRKNMLSPNYQNIGFAIKTGSLTGEDTVLVVEMFGTGTSAMAKDSQTSVSTVAKIEQQVNTQTNTEPFVTPQLDKTQIAKRMPGELTIQGAETKPIFNSKNLSRNIVLIIVYILILTLIIDVLIIEKKKVIRFVGHNLDHVLFMIFVLSLVFLFTKGFII